MSIGEIFSSVDVMDCRKATGLIAKQLITGSSSSLKTGSTLGCSYGDSHIRNCVLKKIWWTKYNR